MNASPQCKDYELLKELGVFTDEDFITKGSFTSDSIHYYCNSLAKDINIEVQELEKLVSEIQMSDREKDLLTFIFNELNDISSLLESSAYFYEIILETRISNIQKNSYNGFALNGSNILKKLDFLQITLFITKNPYFVTRIENIRVSVKNSMIKQIKGLPPNLIDNLREFKKFIDTFDIEKFKKHVDTLDAKEDK